MDKAHGPTLSGPDVPSRAAAGRGSSDEDLARANALLDAHVDNSPLAVVEFDPEFRITRWAASAQRVFGYTASEVLGRRISELHWVYEDDIPKVKRESARLLDGRKRRGANVNRNYRADGSIIWCEWHSSAIRDPEGHLVSVLSLVLDITERRIAEERARQELENTRILLETAHALASGRSLREVLDALCDAVLHALKHRRVSVSLWHESRRVIETAASKGTPTIPIGGTLGFDDLTEPGRRILETRESAVIDYDAVPPGEAARRGQVPSHLALGVPLVYGDRLVGLLTIDDPGARRAFTDREIEIATGIASQASVAIEHARLFEDDRERARLNEALAAIDRVAHGSLEWRDVAERALEEAAKAIGAECGCVLGSESEGWVAWSVFGFEPTIAGWHFTEAEVDRQILAAARSATVAVDDVLADARLDSAVLTQSGVKSAIGAPLVVRGETIAIVVFGYQSDLHHFTANEVEFATMAASTMSLALENARLFGEERDVSHRLQEALLTLPDRVEGIEFAHAYRSAAETARVGGDFYDLFEIGAGSVGVTIGDVAGKGLDAAVLTSLAKNAIRTHAIEGGKSPAEILTATNDVVFHATPVESFVTVFFGTLDRFSGRLVYASAGHPAAMVATAGGAVAKLIATGPLLGAFDRAKFEQAERPLAYDDLLFLYTDGLTEARRGGEQFGEQRVVDLFTDSDRIPSHAVRRALAEVVAHTGGRLHDDLALMAVRRLRPEDETPRRQLIEV